jgi:hypothetical protein
MSAVPAGKCQGSTSVRLWPLSSKSFPLTIRHLSHVTASYKIHRKEFQAKRSLPMHATYLVQLILCALMTLITCHKMLFITQLSPPPVNSKYSLDYSVIKRVVKYEGCIVTYRPSARQLLRKQIPTEAYERNNRTSIARQQITKQAFSTIERLCFLCGPCRGVIRGQRRLFELGPTVIKIWS